MPAGTMLAFFNTPPAAMMAVRCSSPITGLLRSVLSLDYPLPPESVELLERYIREFRPHLTSQGKTALFPGTAGGPKNQAFFGDQISRTIRGNAWCPLICCQSFGLIEEATAAAAASSRRISDF